MDVLQLSSKKKYFEIETLKVNYLYVLKRLIETSTDNNKKNVKELLDAQTLKQLKDNKIGAGAKILLEKLTQI